MNSCLRKMVLALLTGILSLTMSAAAFAMPSDVGGTWNGYDSFDDWFYAQYGHYPPEEPDYYNDGVGYIDEVWWSGSTAKWSFDGNCRRFEVRLYRDDHHVATEKTSKTRISFSSEMDEEGDYTFKVRAIYGNQTSDWSDESDTHYTRGKSYHSESGGSRSSSGNSGGPADIAADGQWIQSNDGTGRWWYSHANGGYTTNGWEMINGKWYFFDGSGWMATGWVHWNGNTYYCMNDGSMVTGNAIIDGNSCYFNESGALR